MRRSFGPRMGGGGGGGNSGGMIKTVHRAVRAGMGGSGGSSIEPYSQFSSARSTTSTNNRSNKNQTLNTSLFLSNNCNTTTSPYVPVTGQPNWDILTPPAITGDHELFDWEYVDEGGSCGSDGESVYGFYDDIVYGSVPSKDEVHHAVSSLQEVLEPVSFGQLMKDRRTHGSDDDGVEHISSQTSFHTPESDWIEPSMHSLQVPGVGKVYDAFHLLQTEPCVQRMVMSLSSDKAVWDAVMNNEMVRELRESVSEADKSISDASEDHDSNPVTQVLRWIFVNTKDKVIEIVEKLTKIVNELIQPMNKDETSKRDDNAGLTAFEENLRSSFFLSIMVLLIVVVTRAHKC